MASAIRVAIFTIALLLMNTHAKQSEDSQASMSYGQDVPSTEHRVHKALSRPGRLSHAHKARFKLSFAGVNNHVNWFQGIMGFDQKGIAIKPVTNVPGTAPVATKSCHVLALQVPGVDITANAGGAGGTVVLSHVLKDDAEDQAIANHAMTGFNAYEFTLNRLQLRFKDAANGLPPKVEYLPSAADANDAACFLPYLQGVATFAEIPSWCNIAISEQIGGCEVYLAKKTTPAAGDRWIMMHINLNSFHVGGNLADNKRWDTSQIQGVPEKLQFKSYSSKRKQRMAAAIATAMDNVQPAGNTAKAFKLTDDMYNDGSHATWPVCIRYQATWDCKAVKVTSGTNKVETIDFATWN